MEIIVKRKYNLDIVTGFWLSDYDNAIEFKTAKYNFGIEFETEQDAIRAFEKISLLIKNACKKNENAYISWTELDGVTKNCT